MFLAFLQRCTRLIRRKRKQSNLSLFKINIVPAPSQNKFNARNTRNLEKSASSKKCNYSLISPNQINFDFSRQEDITTLCKNIPIWFPVSDFFWQLIKKNQQLNPIIFKFVDILSQFSYIGFILWCPLFMENVCLQIKRFWILPSI